MSEGVINSSSGAHEHKTDVESGLVNKDKSTYTQQSVELQQQNIRKRKPQSRYFEEQKYYNSAYDEKNYGSRDRVDNSTAQEVIYQDGSGSKPISQGLIQKNERSVANGNISNDDRYKKNIQNGYRVTKIETDYQNNSETGIKGVSYSDNITSQEVRYHEMAALQSVENTLHSSALSSSQRVGDYLKSPQAVSPLHRNQLLTKVKSGSGGTFKKVKSSIGTAVAGTSFLANDESFQTDTGENSINAIKKSADHVVNKLDKLSAKSGKSRYFRTAAKASDSVTFVSHADKLKNAVYKGQQIGKKGLVAVGKGLNPLVRTLNLSDDVGAQSIIKAVDITKVSGNAAKMSYKTTKQAVQATSKATRYTVNHARIGLENAAKYSKQVISRSKKAAKVVSKTAQTVARATAETAEKASAAVSRFITFVISNPATIIIAVVALLLVIIIGLCSTIVGAGKYSSYGGVGDNGDTLSLNEYSEVYDYINESIATRCRDLFNMHDTWTGYLKYEYNYEIENADGSITTTTNYPVADVAPIMAYLSVTYQSYTLNQSIKNEIDDIVNGLYTFTYVIAPYSYSVDHGSGGVTTYTGEQITYTIRYHDASKYMEDNNLIPEEEMSVYNAVKSYGDNAYFKMYNLLKNKNWHEWVSEQYGYTLVSNVSGIHDIRTYRLKRQGYIEMNYLNSDNDTADKIYSPITGTVTEVVIDSVDDSVDYTTLITIKDDDNNLEFQLMSDMSGKLNPTVSVGDSINTGDLIANNTYHFKFSCIYNGSNINPMLIMDYYQHM